MRRGTTPTITITVSDYDLSYATDIWVTFEQTSSGTEITREWKRYPDDDDEDANDGISVTGQVITVKLGQDETLEFSKGSVKLQAKFKTDDFDDSTTRDTVVASDVVTLQVDDILNEDVM